MKNTLSIKAQSKRSTKWMEKSCVNANIIFGNFEIGIVTSAGWGNFDEGETNVQVSIDGKDYDIPLANFKNMIKTKNYPNP